MSADLLGMAARHGAVLASLAELTLAGARRVAARLEDAETSAEVAELSLALSRIGRSVRQTLLLETRLVRERRTIERDATDEAGKAGDAAAKAARAARKSQVRVAVGRIAHEAIESVETAEQIVGDIEDLLEDYLRAYGEAPVEAVVEAICRDFNIAVPEALAPIPEPPSSPQLVQVPDGGWAPETDSS